MSLLREAFLLIQKKDLKTAFRNPLFCLNIITAAFRLQFDFCFRLVAYFRNHFEKISIPMFNLRRLKAAKA